MPPGDVVDKALSARPRKWLVTGAAGFIGSHLVETLLARGQAVVGLDDFSNGHRRNLEDVRAAVSAEQWGRFRLLEADIRDAGACREASAGVELVLHQAALGSVPKSIADPLRWHSVNATGSLNVFLSARDAGVQRVVYASSSSVYGDDPELPRREARTGRPLSPYASSKAGMELDAQVMSSCYGLQAIGLRYFNVFGPRQDPEGAYAAVVPQWTFAMLAGLPTAINGDGETSRDFCYVANVVQANLLAALTPEPEAVNRVYNIGAGARTSLNELHRMLCALVQPFATAALSAPLQRELRAGDVRHSHADISLARELLGYRPEFDVRRGLELTVGWYAARRAQK